MKPQTVKSILPGIIICYLALAMLAGHVTSHNNFKDSIPNNKCSDTLDKDSHKTISYNTNQ